MQSTPPSKESTMQTVSQSEIDVRAFAAEFNTPNVQRALALCEDGTLRWSDVAEVFRSSLAKGLKEVSS